VDYTDVDQGMLGNCYLAAVASSIAHLNPDKIKDIVRVSDWIDPASDESLNYFEADFYNMYGDQSEAEFIGRNDLEFKLPIQEENGMLVSKGKLPIQREGKTAPDWDISGASIAIETKSWGYRTSNIATLPDSPVGGADGLDEIPFKAGFAEKAFYNLSFEDGQYEFHFPKTLTLTNDSKTQLDLNSYEIIVNYRIKKTRYISEIRPPFEKKTITVDNKFWHTDTKDGYDPIYGEDNGGKENGEDTKKDIWWPVMEKAYACFVTRRPKWLEYASMESGYDQIGNGGYIHYAQAILLNSTPRIWYPDYMSTSKLYDYLLAYAPQGHGEGKYVCNFGTRSSQATIDNILEKEEYAHLRGTVVAGHAYSVHRAYLDSEGKMFVECRNPWGNNGVYGETSYPAESTDGVFHMPLTLFQKVVSYCSSAYCSQAVSEDGNIHTDDVIIEEIPEPDYDNRIVNKKDSDEDSDMGSGEVIFLVGALALLSFGIAGLFFL
jgi:hypothetical protein